MSKSIVEPDASVTLSMKMRQGEHWNCHDKIIRLHRGRNLCNGYARTDDVTPELAPFESGNESGNSPGEMDVNVGEHDEQDEAGQREDLRRVLAARQPVELERQKHLQTNHAVLSLWCEVCARAKGTGAQHRRQTVKELARQEQEGARICSDFLYMSEAGVATPTRASRFRRSGRVTVTALEQKGLRQYGVKFFAGFINKSDGEPAMKALRSAAAEGPRRSREHWTGIARGKSPSEW